MSNYSEKWSFKARVSIEKFKSQKIKPGDLVYMYWDYRPANAQRTCLILDFNFEDGFGTVKVFCLLGKRANESGQMIEFEITNYTFKKLA